MRVVNAASETARPYQMARIKSSLLATCSLFRIRFEQVEDRRERDVLGTATQLAPVRV